MELKKILPILECLYIHLFVRTKEKDEFIGYIKPYKPETVEKWLENEVIKIIGFNKICVTVIINSNKRG